MHRGGASGSFPGITLFRPGHSSGKAVSCGESAFSCARELSARPRERARAAGLPPLRPPASRGGKTAPGLSSVRRGLRSPPAPARFELSPHGAFAPGPVTPERPGVFRAGFPLLGFKAAYWRRKGKKRSCGGRPGLFSQAGRAERARGRCFFRKQRASAPVMHVFSPLFPKKKKKAKKMLDGRGQNA